VRKKRGHKDEEKKGKMTEEKKLRQTQKTLKCREDAYFVLS